LPFRSSDQ